MRELRQELEGDEDLVAGSVSPEEARLWLLCCQWIERGHAAGSRAHGKGRPATSSSTKDGRLFAVVNHPRMIEEEMKRRRVGCNPAGILQDSKGRWRYGDGAEAIPTPDGGFKRRS